MDNEIVDLRPAPKPRKYPQLWQAYLFYDELVEMRKRHLLRISSAERGKSTFDTDFEQSMMDDLGLTDVDAETAQAIKSHIGKKPKSMIDYARLTMINFGEFVPVWDWVTSIRGLGDGTLAARLLAQIDDISSFSNISKLWRFCGYAVIDGKREVPQKGEKGHYNRRLKATCFLIADQFVKQRTPLYRDIYDDEKLRLRDIHPEPVKRDKPIGKITNDYTDAHLHAMAMRKSIKVFLSHLWLLWREAEGLDISQPYAIAILNHADYIAPMESVIS